MKLPQGRPATGSWRPHRTIAHRLAGRPWAFLAGRDYIEHVWFVIRRVKWWQLLLAVILFPLFVRIEGGFAEAYGLYAMGFAFAPVMEEGAKAWSLRTHAGRRLFGAGFAIGFPVVEALLFLNLANQMHALSGERVLLRACGVILHLYTHFVLAYQLSLFGQRHRTTGSFITAILIHGGFNAATTGYMSIVYG